VKLFVRLTDGTACQRFSLVEPYKSYSLCCFTGFCNPTTTTPAVHLYVGHKTYTTRGALRQVPISRCGRHSL